MNDESTQDDSQGFVFAATGALYTTLARRAARSLRQIHPDAEIDLFTDADVADDVFSQIHHLSDSWFRPKMEALERSRFDRTVFLDADIMVIGDLSPLFEVLDRFDLAGAQDRGMNSDEAMILHTRSLPVTFPHINSGVLAVRRTADTQAFLRHWQEAVRSSGAHRDQPAFCELLYDSDLRFCTLPPTFNFMTFNELLAWRGSFSAPRVLHAPDLHRRGIGGDPMTPFHIDELVGRANAYRLRVLIHADRRLTPGVPMLSRNMFNPMRPGIRRRYAALKEKWRNRRDTQL